MSYPNHYQMYYQQDLLVGRVYREWIEATQRQSLWAAYIAFMKDYRGGNHYPRGQHDTYYVYTLGASTNSDGQLVFMPVAVVPENDHNFVEDAFKASPMAAAATFSIVNGFFGDLEPYSVVPSKNSLQEELSFALNSHYRF